MKKTLAILLAAGMFAASAGCSLLGGSKYKKESKKMIKAAEEACSAQEANKKQMKKLPDATMNRNDSGFEKGIYASMDQETFEKYKSDNNKYEDGTVLNISFFFKFVGEDTMMAKVIEFANEDLVWNDFDGILGIINKGALTDYEAYYEDFVYFLEINDDSLEMMYDNGDDGKASGVYAKVDGNVIVMVSYSGSNRSDLLDEFYEFMDEAGYPDYEEKLDDAE